jgi:hypothetical protein
MTENSNHFNDYYKSLATACEFKAQSSKLNAHSLKHSIIFFET